MLSSSSLDTIRPPCLFGREIRMDELDKNTALFRAQHPHLFEKAARRREYERSTSYSDPRYSLSRNKGLVPVDVFMRRALVPMLDMNENN